jgi:hypothetical protein
MVNEDWDNWYIELYEVCPCENREQLCKREGEIIRLIGNYILHDCRNVGLKRFFVY